MDCIQLLIYVILLYEEYYTSFINYFNLIDFLRLIISIDATANIAIAVSETPITKCFDIIMSLIWTHLIPKSKYIFLI